MAKRPNSKRNVDNPDRTRPSRAGCNPRLLRPESSSVTSTGQPTLIGKQTPANCFKSHKV